MKAMTWRTGLAAGLVVVLSGCNLISAGANLVQDREREKQRQSDKAHAENQEKARQEKYKKEEAERQAKAAAEK